MEGRVNGRECTIKLDTGAQLTMISKRLVTADEISDQTIPIRSIHKDVVHYPLAEVQLEVDGDKTTCAVAVSEKLEEDDLILGSDNPSFNTILQKALIQRMKHGAKVMVVQTRKQSATEEQQQRDDEKATKQSGATLVVWSELIGPETDHIVDQNNKPQASKAYPQALPQAATEEDRLNDESDTELDGTQPHSDHVPDKDPEYNQVESPNFKDEQRQDPSLQSAWDQIDKQEDTFYYTENGWLYQRGVDAIGNDIKQLVLPTSRRRQATRLDHTMPMAGHLGARKTQFRLLKRFYWPGLHRDVKLACQSCPVCQKAVKRQGTEHHSSLCL